MDFEIAPSAYILLITIYINKNKISFSLLFLHLNFTGFIPGSFNRKQEFELASPSSVQLFIHGKTITMKKLPALFFYAIACITISFSCMHNDHDTSISYKESDDTYSMKAHYSKSRTKDVERYMDKRIGRRSNMSFVNSRIDGTIALDDHTTFYIKKYPGVLEIKLDKEHNSYEGYDEIKSMCQGIKKVVTQ